MKKSAESSASFLDGSVGAAEDESTDDIPETIVVTDVLDLHGTPIKIIPEMVDEFLSNAVDLELATVQIIHGKGKSRLKHLVLDLLACASQVERYYDAPPQFGGWGRTIVELKLEKSLEQSE